MTHFGVIPVISWQGRTICKEGIEEFLHRHKRFFFDLPGKGLAVARERRRVTDRIGLNRAILAILMLPEQHQSLVRGSCGRSVWNMTSLLNAHTSELVSTVCQVADNRSFT